MSKLLLMAFSAMSDQDANGMTIKALLSAWGPEELCQFYYSPQSPDFSACRNYFRVTDVQMLKSFLGKRAVHIYERDAAPAVASRGETQNAKALPPFLRKMNYNFFLRWVRECLWCIAPWGKKEFRAWVREQNPRAIVYMVGESFFLDGLVLETAELLGIPLILYNCEAYRTIDTKKRRGLDRLYYRRLEKTYRRLQSRSALTIFNSAYLREKYTARYGAGENMLAYNCGSGHTSDYAPGKELRLAYFGNLGIGRTEALLELAQVLYGLQPELYIDVYGSSRGGDEEKLKHVPNIRFHGFVTQEELSRVKERTDILIHTESFRPDIIAKLGHAFSTKLAQYLCAGRCILSYAPLEMASTLYLRQEDCAITAVSRQELKEKLAALLEDPDVISCYAAKAKEAARRNHDRERTAAEVRCRVEGICHEV